MHLELPDDIVMRAEANVTDILLALAIQLYADNRIDHTDACRLAGLPKSLLNQELSCRGIGIHMYPSLREPLRQAG